MEKSTKSGINILFDNQSNINLLNNSRDKMIEIFVKLSKDITFNVHFLRKRKSLLMKINNNSGRTNYEEREKGSRIRNKVSLRACTIIRGKRSSLRKKSEGAVRVIRKVAATTWPLLKSGGPRPLNRNLYPGPPFGHTVRKARIYHRKFQTDFN